MSKAIKQSIIFLVCVVLLSFVMTAMTFLEKKKLEAKANSLTQQVAESQTKQSQLIAESGKLKEQINSLNDQLAAKDKERSKYQSQYEELKSRYDKLDTQVGQLSRERDDWKDRTTTITQERDRLMKELQDRPEKIVEKVVYKEKEVPAAAAGAVPPAASVAPPVAAARPMVAQNEDEEENKTDDAEESSEVVKQAEADSAKQKKDEAHWAEILKEKAGLELEIEKTKKELDQSAIEIVELKKEASDFQLEIDKLKSERDEIVRKIKYGQDLADNLSIELARAKNDQKFTTERADKMTAENSNLQSQVKQLASTKLALEKTIARLTGDKDQIQKKLVESESVIQSRIDDIWKIKQNIDTHIKSVPSGGNQVELSPIVVNANGSSESPSTSAMAGARTKTQGHIVSINTDNNFVIIDMGDKDGVKMGNVYRVYRGSKEIAKLEVIQVRRDIAAADIKKKAAPLQVGDAIR